MKTSRISIVLNGVVYYGRMVRVDGDGGMWVRWDSPYDNPEPSGPYYAGEIKLLSIA